MPTTAQLPGHEVDLGIGQERPAHAVEVAGDSVDRLDRPLAHGAELLGRHTHPAVRHGTICLGKITGDATDLARIDPGDRSGPLRCGGGARIAHAVHARQREMFDACVVHAPLMHQHMQDRQQQRRIGAGPDEVVLVGDGGGLGAARVDHHQPTAATAQVAHAVPEVGCGHHRPVGHHRVCAEDQEMIGVVEVGNGDLELMPVHQVRHQLDGKLVGRCRGEHVLRTQGAEERQAVGCESEAVHTRIAEIEADRVAAVVTLCCRDAFGHQRCRVFPADRLPPAVGGLANRGAEPVGIGVQIGQRCRLGADVPARQWIVAVAADVGDAVVFHGDLQSTDGFAEIAHAVRGEGQHVCRG